MEDVSGDVDRLEQILELIGMRNVIAHDYGAILPRLLWNVIAKDLDILALACRTELGRLSP